MQNRGVAGGGGNPNTYMNPANNALLPEPLIWTYVVQLTSALRCIHQVKCYKSPWKSTEPLFLS